MDVVRDEEPGVGGGKTADLVSWTRPGCLGSESDVAEATDAIEDVSMPIRVSLAKTSERENEKREGKGMAIVPPEAIRKSNRQF